MTGTVGQIEKKTQARVVALFRDRLCYDYLGDRSELDNRNIEETLLRTWLGPGRVAAQDVQVLHLMGLGMLAQLVGLVLDAVREFVEHPTRWAGVTPADGSDDVAARASRRRAEPVEDWPRGPP